MPQLELSCFGAFQATLSGERLTSFRRVKVQALLAYLVLEADRPHARETLATLLWPLDAEASARSSLRQTLYELRRLLGDNDRSLTPFLRITRQTVQFNPGSDYSLDAADFLRCQEQGELVQAAAHYRDDLLVGFLCESEPFEEWLRLTRERFHNLALDVLFTLTEKALKQTDASQARAYAQRQLALEPWREEAHRQLMSALALGGERSAALAQYETCRRVLAEEFGVEPDAETAMLHEQIKAGNVRSSAPATHANAPTRSPAAGAALDLLRHNLPSQPTPFVGRAAALAQISARLQDPDCRLLTVVGAGGMGKTRLAIRAAQDLRAGAGRQATCGDGILFVALAPIGSTDLLVPTIADALGFTFYGSADPKTQLMEYLRPKSMLLVLDNFEHLLAGVDLVSDLLAVAPGVKVLVTSREPLNLFEEWLYPLGGMRLPDEGSDEDVAALAAYSSVELFARCAQRVRPEFNLAKECMHVVRICQLVEGMPLGIELAAAWRKVFTSEQIAQEVARSLDFLATPLRNVPARHRSMRAVFEHSWRLLTSEEQQVFARLAVFRGGFQQEAAQSVAAASLPLLLALVEKSLLQLTPDRRFQLHELLRQFAEEKLQAIPQAAAQTQDRHCDYYLSFLQHQETHLTGKEHRAAMTAVEAELENVRTAWQWAVQHHKLDQIDRALESLFFFYFSKSWFVEGEMVFRRAAEALAMQDPIGRQGTLLGKILGKNAVMLVHVATEVGRADARTVAEQLAQQSLTILSRLDEASETGEALHVLGDLYYRSGQFEQGAELLQQSLTLARARGDHRKTARTLGNLGLLSFCRGDYRQSIDYFRQGIALSEERGDPVTLGHLLGMLGEAHQALGEYVEAQQAAQAALIARTTAGDQRGVAMSLQLLGELNWQMGDYAFAQQRSQASLELFQQIGLAKLSEVAQNNLGHIACSLGDYRQAKVHFCAVLASNAEAGLIDFVWQVAEALTGMATVLIKEGKAAQAAELLNQVLHHPAAWQETKDRAAKLLTELSVELPPDVMAQAQARGQTQYLTATVAALLAESHASEQPVLSSTATAIANRLPSTDAP
jgi:predicted ATPase/DNA-binding SARP family transcriptional activator